MNKLTLGVNIGRKHDYARVWALQGLLQQSVIAAKRKQEQFRPNYLLFCEHNPVYTLGKSGKIENRLHDTRAYSDGKPDFFKINRGGDITYHGPGQLTVYPIFDLDQFYCDLHRYVRDLEEVVIITLRHFGINGTRIKGLTGVWVVDEREEKRKLCAIGVHMSRWVSMHGLALNVSTDLNYFSGIIPCGISEKDKTVSSISQELGHHITIEEVRDRLKLSFLQVFDLHFL